MAAQRTLTLLTLISVSSSQASDCSYIDLLDHLNLTQSNNVLEITRPVKNWTSPTLVQLELVLYGILAVDEKSQTVTGHIWMTKYWKNEFLNWDSSDFCGMNELFVPRSRLWIPDIVIEQDASDSGSLHEDSWVTLYPDGLVATFARQRLTFTCQFNLYNFPFDEQSCNISFVSMGADVRSLILESAKNDSILTKQSEEYMITKGEWDLIGIQIVNTNKTHGQKTYSTLIYMVTIKRRALLYVINFIIPLVYLLILDLGSFFISEARGEKLSFKVTVLLSISVLLLILKDILPSTEDRLPMIASLCVSVFTLVWFSVLEAMLVGFLIDLDGCCGKKTQSSVERFDIQQEARCHRESPGAEQNGPVELETGRLADVEPLKLILDSVKAARREAGGRDQREKKTGCLRRVAQIVDALFFAAYFVTVSAFVIYICTEWIEI